MCSDGQFELCAWSLALSGTRTKQTNLGSDLLQQVMAVLNSLACTPIFPDVLLSTVKLPGLSILTFLAEEEKKTCTPVI